MRSLIAHQGVSEQRSLFVEGNEYWVFNLIKDHSHSLQFQFYDQYIAKLWHRSFINYSRLSPYDFSDLLHSARFWTLTWIKQDQMNLDLWPRERTIFCHKRPYKAIKRPCKTTQDHTRPHKATHANCRKNNSKNIRGEATQGHSRQTWQCNFHNVINVPQKITLCSHWATKVNSSLYTVP